MTSIRLDILFAVLMYHLHVSHLSWNVSFCKNGDGKKKNLELRELYSVLALYFFSIFYYSNMFSFRLFCTQQLLCQHYFLMVVQVTSNRSSDSSRQFFTLSKKSAKMPHPNSHIATEVNSAELSFLFIFSKPLFYRVTNFLLIYVFLHCQCSFNFSLFLPKLVMLK